MKRVYRIFLLMLAGCWVLGCDSPGGKPGRRHGGAEGSMDNAASLRPDVFTEAPGVVEGCVGLYTYDSLNIPFDSLDVDQGKKILAVKASSFAFLRLHGKNIVLRYDSAQSIKMGESGDKQVYRGSDYEVVLTTRKLLEEEEAVRESGTLEIIHGDKHFTAKVKGIFGC